MSHLLDIVTLAEQVFSLGVAKRRTRDKLKKGATEQLRLLLAEEEVAMVILLHSDAFIPMTHIHTRGMNLTCVHKKKTLS